MRRSTLFRVSQTILIIFLVAGCGADSDFSINSPPSVSEQDFSSPIPTFLTKHIADNGGKDITAVVAVEGGALFDLTPDIANKKMTGKIDGLMKGQNHRFSLTYFIGGVKVAESGQTVFVDAKAATPLTFSAPTYFDDDQDGFTNMSEIETGNNPNDATDRPVSNIIRLSQNYVLADVVSTPFLVGESSSQNYQITAGL
jgi:hypothetical protein